MWPAIQPLLSRVFRRARKDASVSFQREPSPERATPSPIAIVGLVYDEQDRRLLAGLGSRNQWKLSFADSFETAQGLVIQHRAPVVLCDRDVPGREWWEVVEALSARRHRPCVLLVSRVVDDYLWNEVVRRGGYDLLRKPLREDEVLRAIKLAWSYWNSTAKARFDARTAAR